MRGTSLCTQTDNITSARMARIRQAGTHAELAVRAALRCLGLSYRLNVRSLPGSPDLANKRRGFAVFVQGCFWHQHTACARATIPKRNTEFWTAKFEVNRKRDARAIRELRQAGYRVIVVWECQAPRSAALLVRLRRLLWIA
jgi:DNA mismatch endonuclease Vsr